MKSELRFTGTNWKVHFTVGFFITVLVIVLALVYRFEVGLILLSIGGSIAAIGCVLVVGIGRKVIHKHRMHSIEESKATQELRLLTAKANKAELESFVLSFPSSQRQLISPNAPIRLIEATSYKELPSPSAEQKPLDLLSVFTQPTQSYACIGGQQTGKTYQMRHIAAHWLGKGFKPVVVGPKWDKGEWAGCVLFGGNGDFAEVSKGITIVRQEAQKRHAADMSHKEHSILPVFFDDWTPIVDSVDNARELVLQATTLYASVNIILYFILHSDTANAWGVDRKGAALKDNFIKLFIIPHYDANGLVVRDKTTGYIKFAGDNAEYPVKLFGGPVLSHVEGPVASPDRPVMESSEFINLEVEPTPTEAAILALHRQGEHHKAICEAMGWTPGGKQYQRIDEVLARFTPTTGTGS